MRIIGPGLATAVYKFLGPKVCYLSDSVSFIGSATLLATLALSRSFPSATSQAEAMPTKLDAAAVESAAPAQTAPEQPEPAPRAGFATILPDMQQGLSFIVHHAAMLFIIIAMATSMFIIGCFAPLIAIYVRDVLHARAGVYAIVTPMIGVGMLFGMNALGALAKRTSDTVLIYSGLFGIALGLVILAAVPQIWSAILGNLVIGVAVAGIMVPAQTLIQRETPPALMGRVGSTVMSVIFTAQILGLVLSGQLSQHFGTRKVFALCAIFLVILIIANKLFLRPTRLAATT